MSDIDQRGSQVGGSLRATGTVHRDSGLIVTTGTATVLPWECDLLIARGADWLLNVTWSDTGGQPVDLSSGATATFTIENPAGGTPVVSLTEAAGITLGAGSPPPNIAVLLTATQIAALTFVRSRYQLAVTIGGTTTLLVSGLARLE
jgi:hypothetical protein